MSSWFSRLSSGLKKTSQSLSEGITGVFTKRTLDDAMLEELEELLIAADVGTGVAMETVEALRRERFEKEVSESEVREFLAARIAGILEPVAKPLDITTHTPFILLVVGVNGNGKTTTIGKLAREYGIEDEVRKRVEEGSLALFGTCAGAIWLAKEIVGYPEQPRLGVLEAWVERNAFGRQVESFEEDLEVEGLGSFHGVFIRAPVFRRLGEGVEVLARLGDLPVLVRQGKVLASSFHPELTEDPRLHRYFLELAGV